MASRIIIARATYVIAEHKNWELRFFLVFVAGTSVTRVVALSSINIILRHIFAVKVNRAGKAIVNYHDIISTVIQLQGGFKVSVIIGFQFVHFLIQPYTDSCFSGFCLNCTGEKKFTVLDGSSAKDYIPACRRFALGGVLPSVGISAVCQYPCTDQICIVGDLTVTDILHNTVQKVLHFLWFHVIQPASGQTKNQGSQKEKNDRMLQLLLLLCATDDGEVGIRGYPINECIEQPKNHKTNQCCLSKQCNICHIEHPKKQAN